MRLLATRLTAIAGAARRVAAAFSPASLFAANEPGAWYDPSDLTTLFQDAAGTTPVTAVEQPVGLLLDKSRGLVPGPELVTNGDFSAGTTGWNANATNSTISVSAGALTLTRDSTGRATAYAQISTVVGQSYKFDGSVTGLTGSIGLLYFSAATSLSNPLQNSTVSASTVASGGKPFVFVAKATTTFIHLVIDNAGPGGTATIDNISIRELPGDPARQTTATARPLYRSPPQRVFFDGVDDVHNITFPVSLGSNCTVARAIPGVGASILTGQTIGTTFANSTTHAGMVIINRALTAGETAQLTAYLNAKADV